MLALFEDSLENVLEPLGGAGLVQTLLNEFSDQVEWDELQWGSEGAVFHLLPPAVWSAILAAGPGNCVTVDNPGRMPHLYTAFCETVGGRLLCVRPYCV